jgi:Protein of unknown function (DUF1360)
MTAAPMPAGRFALAALATWRVTHLLAQEDGPADVVVRLRRRAGSGWPGDLLDCFYCLSVWVAVPCGVGLAGRYRANPLWYLAVSGAACLLEQATRPAPDAHPHGDSAAEPQETPTTMERTEP